MQSRAIQKGAHPCSLTAVCEDGQVFLGAIVLAGKAKQFKQEGAALGVERSIAHLLAKRLDRIL